MLRLRPEAKRVKLRHPESANESAPQTSEGAPIGSSHETPPYSEPGLQDFLARAGRDYENIRRTQKASGARTAAMTEAVRSIQQRVAEVPPQIIQQSLTAQIKENTAGSRIVALAIAADHVSPGNLTFLLDMFGRFRTPFEHYWCIRALMAHSGFLSADQASEVVASYEKNQRAIESDPGRSGLAGQLLNLAKARARTAESSNPVATAKARMMGFDPPEL
jgi:hypothetical protein